MSQVGSHHSASFRTGLNEDLGAIIESKELGLSNLQKGYLRLRWLEQVVRTERELTRSTRRQRILRMATVVGSITLLMLVSLNLAGEKLAGVARYVPFFSIFFSLVVCSSVAVEHFFNYEERSRKAERLVERLKTEGWRFLQMSGAYQSYANHSEAFATFANQVESLTQSQVEVYSLDMVRGRKVEAQASAEEESPKKSEQLSQRESGHLIETSPSVPNVVTRHLNQHRIQ
ncbi:MAG TPA: DUF4231 domain-containing protein [Pyrinomonadaceae bacterium]